MRELFGSEKDELDDLDKSQDMTSKMDINLDEKKDLDNQSQNQLVSIFDQDAKQKSRLEKNKKKEDGKMTDDIRIDNPENDDDANKKKKEYAFENQTLKFRNGISPVTHNIRNIRYKKKPEFDTDQVHGVERILKDLIDYGFAKHVDE